MRIGLVIEHFDPRRGGAERWTCQLAEQLLARGHDVHVVAGDTQPEGPPLPVHFHPLPGKHTRLGFAAAAEDKLRRLPLDVIHDMGAGWYADVLLSHDGVRFAQWEQKVRMLPAWTRPIKRAMIRHLPRYESFRRLIARQVSEPHRIIMALSRMVADDYRRFLGVGDERLRLIYNGVDARRFTPDDRKQHRQPTRRELGVGEGEVLLLFVGHDFVRKGLATLLRAMGRLARGGLPLRLAVVGGKRIAPYRRLAERHGAGASVRFVGPVADPTPYYAAADAYVLPTFYDPCSLGVLEAASAGLPCITTRMNGAGELLTEGVSGYVIDDPADDAALAERLSRVTDTNRCQAMGAAARQMALQNTFERNVENVLGIYAEVAGRRRRAA